VDRKNQITERARKIFGERLLGIFAFGSRITGGARPDSDLDLAIWLRGPLKRRDTWLAWADEFAASEKTLDPTFITAASFREPPPWLLEAVHGGVEIYFDPGGALQEHLSTLRADLDGGRYHRRLFMGLPYYERVTS
jgi:predicted nucleotidyltransferase